MPHPSHVVLRFLPMDCMRALAAEIIVSVHKRQTLLNLVLPVFGEPFHGVLNVSNTNT